MYQKQFERIHMTTFIILLVLIGFAAAYYFLKPTYDDSWKKELDGFELDRENVEKVEKKDFFIILFIINLLYYFYRLWL